MTERFKDFHDSELVGIEHHRKMHSLSLRVVKSTGDKWLIDFIGVKWFRCADYHAQNVIYELKCSDEKSIDGDAVDGWIEWIYDGRSGATNAENIQKGELLLFTLTQSFGARVAVIAQEISLLRIDKSSTK